MKSVAIMMSTYNGEKYLREQLDSILAQVGVEVTLYIRDDGSNDSTKSILNEYSEKHSNVHLIFGANVGVGNSFMELLYSAPDTFDYYAFSDQDDFWESEKIVEAIKILEEKNALLYVSDLNCVDQDLNPIGMRYKNKSEINLQPEAIIYSNNLNGCTMVFPNRFYKTLVEEEHRPNPEVLIIKNHDGWIAAVAALFNGIFFDERSFIKYRQHAGNVVGAYGGFRKKIKGWNKKFSHRKYRALTWRLANEICKKFPNEAVNFPLILLYTRAKTFKGKMKLIKNNKKLRSYTSEGYFHYFIKVMLGWL